VEEGAAASETVKRQNRARDENIHQGTESPIIMEKAKRQKRARDENIHPAEKEMGQLRDEKTQLTNELATASQALLKRGDDFSESVRLLQKRLETSDAEAREFRAKLSDSQRTNSRLAAELEDASRLLQRYGSASLDNDGGARLLQERAENAETALRLQEETLRQLVEQERSQAAQAHLQLQ
ncbi:hypothetical protein T484DRAFT_1764417, partial [Baffinella frigidus]